MTVFNEGEKKSATRFGMFFCLVIAAWLSIGVGDPTYNQITLIGAWLLAGIGGKSVGKFFETRNK